MLSFLKSCLLPVKTDFRIAFPVSYSCHGEIHSNFGALTFKVSTEILDDVFRGTLGNTYHMFCSPCLLVFIHYSKLGSGSLTDRTYLRSCFTFINITTYLTYILHTSFLLFFFIFFILFYAVWNISNVKLWFSSQKLPFILLWRRQGKDRKNGYNVLWSFLQNLRLPVYR